MAFERPARYRPLDFTFLANVVDDPNVIFVRPESPIRSLQDLVVGTVTLAEGSRVQADDLVLTME